MKRVARILRDSRDFDKWKYAAMGAFLGCDVQTFLCDDIRDQRAIEVKQLAGPELRVLIQMPKSSLDPVKLGDYLLQFPGRDLGDSALMAGAGLQAHCAANLAHPS